MPASVLAAGLAVAMVAAGVGTAAAQSRVGLQGLRRVALEIIMAPDHPLLDPGALEQRLEAFLLTGASAPRLDPESLDRIRLTVAVRQYSGSELRGFYLPFSGLYGIGSVRLSVERLATIPGLAAPIPAVVWQQERQARGPWHRSAAEIMALVEELAAALVEDVSGGRQ
ncbi:MAG: hypothetical protein HYV93_26330 [Candidatus Rokubacteria bacterium]|nr:hypothetical protein [Candidatus Rokubacteria bacterium]